MKRIILNNSKEIKGVIRAAEREKVVCIKDYAISAVVQADYSKNIESWNVPDMPDQLRAALDDIYNYYYDVDYVTEKVTYNFFDMSTPYIFNKAVLNRYVNYLTCLLEIMQKIEKYQEYLQIIKENMIFKELF